MTRMILTWMVAVAFFLTPRAHALNGGRPDTEDLFPSNVFFPRAWASAVKIDNHHYLTAAHAVQPFVDAGTSYLSVEQAFGILRNKGGRESSVHVKTVSFHPSWIRFTSKLGSGPMARPAFWTSPGISDLALIEVVEENDIAVAELDFAPFSKATITLTGFGADESKNTDPGIFTFGICSIAGLRDSFIALNTDTAGDGSSVSLNHGDSGGAAYIPGSGKSFRVVGINSWGSARLSEKQTLHWNDYLARLDVGVGEDNVRAWICRSVESDSCR